MTACSPQRFLPNSRNLFATAALSTDSVLPVQNKVKPIPFARKGTAQIQLTGTYTGSEQADFEIQIVDTDVEVPRVSTPVFAGVGSGTISDITATGDQQSYIVECADAGTETTTASVQIEGVTIKALQPGATGNSIRLAVDQSTLTFTATIYTLLEDLALGADTFSGQGFDWDSAVLDEGTGRIPLTAHRVAFGADRSNVHLSYKQFVDGAWSYRLVPGLTRNIPKGTAIYFVTGGREVSVTNGDETETYEDIETAYDLLYKLRTESALVVVDGVVANDRSPTGQAARELQLRTDAHAEVSYGTGSPYAGGFINVTVGADAPTQLVTATCFAVNSGDHPSAHLGAERWKLRGSLSGDLGTIVTGIPYSEPFGLFGLTIPQRLPIGYGAPKGRFAMTNISYASQTTQAPICAVGMALGPNVVDQEITLTYTLKPSGDCDCTGMPVPNLSGPCLGATVLTEGAFMDYSAANRERLRDLYEWSSDLIRVHSSYLSFGDPTQDAFVSQPTAIAASTFGYFNPKPLFDVIADWERTLKLINDLPDASPDVKSPAEAAWDTAVAEFEADLGGGASGTQYVDLEAYEALTAGDAVSTFIDNDGTEKIRKAVPRTQSFGIHRYGFVIADAVAGSPPARMYLYGNATVAGAAFTPGQTYYADKTNPGHWTSSAVDGITGEANLNPGYVTGVATSATKLEIGASSSLGSLTALLSDRYRMRMQQVLITGGISPLGKSDADTIVSGDGCWRDPGATAYWKVEGSVRGGYAPLFTNQPYYSSREGADNAIFSTHEFALQLNVKCPQNLQVGDTVRLTISESGWGATYQPGDELVLPLVAASPHYLTGGANGDPEQSWNVTSSLDGPRAVYAFNPDSPVAYDDSGLSFLLHQGGIPFAHGDRFKFAIEGGHYRWRKDGGAWSAAAPIPLATDVVDDGLSAVFTPGAANSFVADDLYKFRAYQPWAVSNTQSPSRAVWKWSGAAAEYVATFDDVEQLDLVALVHDLPEGAVVTLWGGGGPLLSEDGQPILNEDDEEILGDEYTWSETLTWRPGVIWKRIDHQAAYVKLVIQSASGGSVQWPWIGAPISTALSSEFQQVREYRVNRAGGNLQSGRYVGKTISGQVTWTESTLLEADADALAEMLDSLKENDDEPLMFISNISRPDDAVLLARIDADQIEFTDRAAYNQDARYERRVSARLPLAGVLS